MARVQEKAKNQNSIKKALIWLTYCVVSAAIITGLIFLVFWIFNKDDNNKEEKYEETYKNAMHIDFEELAGILNNDEESELHKENVYVFIYSPNYDEYNAGKDELLQSTVNACIDAYKEYDDSLGEYAFYVINVEDEDNKTYLNENPNTLSEYGIDNYPYFLVLTSQENGLAKDNEYSTSSSAMKDLINNLTYAKENMLGE